jgi:lysophospholipase
MVMLGFGDLYIPGGKPDAWELMPFEQSSLTSDPLRYDRVRDVLKAAPWLSLGSPTISWLHSASRSIMQVNSFGFASSIKVPLLIIAAGNDSVVSTRAIEMFSTRVKICQYLVIAGAKHEILQERDEIRDQFWAAFDAYVPGSNRTMSESHLGL